MIGRKFNKLTVLSLDHVEDYTSPLGVKARVQFFNCLCDCGNEKVIRQPKLYTTKSCGCQQTESNIARREDLVGHQYGRLTVLSLDVPTGKWICQCECGGVAYSKKSSLQSGGTRSCGCLQKEKVSAKKISYLKDYRKSKGLPEDIPMKSEDSLERSKFKPLVRQTLARDIYTCAWCSNIGGKLNVHHLETWSTNVEKRFDKNNLVTVCEPCHKLVHNQNWFSLPNPIMTILLQGYVTEVEDGYFNKCTSLELTPN